jgi:trigger factor
MSYTVEEVNGCTKKIIFNFDSLDLTSEISTAVKEKQRSTNLKGFRKGKAPLDMVKQMYGPQIETEALNKFVQGQFFETVDKEGLRVVGYPSFENMKYDAGKSVSFEALVEIFPEIALKDMSALKFTEEKVEITDDEVAKTTQGYLANKAVMKEIEDESTKLENGHHAVLNFEGEQEDGTKPENMKGTDFVLEIGSNQFIPGFEEGMIGMIKGEKKLLELSFPEEYHVAELKNSKVKFDVELLEIKKNEFPELDDELAKELQFESVEDMKTKTKDNLFAQKKRQSNEKLHQAILDKLIEENTFDIPKALVDQQKEQLQKEMSQNLTQQGFNETMLTEYFQKWADDLDEKAKFQVKSGLILDKLAKENNVEATDSDIDAKIDEMSKSSGMDPAEVKKYYTSNDKIKQNLMYALREEKTFDIIKQKVIIA